MSKKIQKWQAVVASFLATGTLYTGMVVPAHAEGERVTNKGKIDLTQFFDEQEKGSNLDDEDPGKREDWFYGQRFGDGNQPDPVARVIALSQAQSLGQYKVKASAINSAGAKPVVPTVPTWKNIGPSPITNEYWTHGSVSGRVTSMSLAPNGNIYIGSAGGGVWVSKNAGQTWSSLTDGQVTLAIGSVAVAKDSKTIYAGTGENSLSLGSDAFYGEGLLVSTDAGTTWQNLHRDLFSGERITSVVVAPSNTQKIFFGSTIGLFQSNDGGKTLTSGNVGIALPDGNGGTITKYQVTSVVQDQKDPNKLFVAVAGHGIYKTTDGGTTWNLLGNGLPTAPLEIGNTALAIAPSNSNYIYASVTNQDPSDMGALTGLYVSKDGGAHWSQLTSTPDFTTQAAYYLDGDYSQGWYDNAITVSPTDPNTVIAAGIGIIKTTDGGKTWKNIVDRNSGIHPDEHAVLFDSSGNLLIGNDGGVFEIMKNGTKKNLNSNLVLTQDYPGMSIFNNGQQVLTGAQDNGSQIYYGPSAWRSVWTGDGAQTLSDPTDPNTMYVSYVNGDLYKTTNGGWNLFTDWNYVAAPVKSAEWVAPLAMDPSDHNTIYEGGENVYKSTDGADSWTKVTNHDKNDTNVTDGTGKEYNVTTIAVAPSNHNVVYAGYGNGYLEMSADGGATWTSIGKDGNVWSDPSVARNNWITGITVDPQNPYNVYVTQSGYRPLHYKSQGHVWHTTDASVATPDWTDLSGTPDAGGLPNAPVNGLALNNGQLVAASDVGVFVSNGDNNWVNLGTGLPTVEVVDVKVAGGVVFAATHGRGTWELSLTQGQNTPASVSITTKEVPVATATSIVGRVVDKDNNPVANAVVDLYDGIKKIDTETTSYDGNFTSSNFVKSGKVG
ncbi:MAG: WD40/YVTN/BNR-like repeat-containing protein, partial [Tumebacillaceae bacterium]